METQPPIIAHRVINSLVNTKKKLLDLLSKLHSKGIQFVEFDIRQTKDDNFVAFHEKRFPKLDRDIEYYTIEDLEKEAQEKIFSFLTLKDILETIPNNFYIHIDLKDKKLNIKKFLEIIGYFRLFGRVFISSFYPKIISKLFYSKIKERWLLTSISLERNPLHLLYAIAPIKTAILCHASGIAPHYSLITKKLIKKAHDKKLKIAGWAVNDDISFKNLQKCGVDFIAVEYFYLIENT